MMLIFTLLSVPHYYVFLKDGSHLQKLGEDASVSDYLFSLSLGNLGD